MALTRLRASNILDSDYKSSCRVTTATNVTLSGGAPSTVDDINLTKYDRVLVRGQNTASQNGIYRVTTVGTGSNGTWIRDADASANDSITAGSIVYVESGTANGGKFFYLTTTGTITIGSTSLSFSDLLGSVATTAITNGNSNVSVAANSNVTVSVAGNANVVTITGTGANISGTANITGNVDIGGNLSITGSLTVNGTTTTINSTTLTVDDLNIVLASGAADAAAANGAGITIDGASATLNYINTSNTWTFDRGITVNGTANITGNANVGNLGTTTAIITTGNITTINSGLVQNGNSNIAITANGNITFTSSSNATVVITPTGANITGTANISGNANVGNLGTAGNISAGYFIGNGSQLTGITASGGVTYTASATAPVGPSEGDQWYETDTDILYTYVNDGTSTFWLDISSFPSTLVNGNSNISIVANSNVLISSTGNANVFVVTGSGVNITGGLSLSGQVGSNLIPSANITYNLGSDTNRWNDLYLANSTIYLGTAQISANATSITITNPGGGQTVLSGASPTISASVGNITTINSGLMQNGNSNVTITANANITLNVTAANSYTFATGSFAPNGNGTQQLGLTGARWSNIWGLSSSAQYADLAEKYQSDANYEPSTVVIFGGEHEITVTHISHDTRVAGVISTAPAYLMNDDESKQGIWLPVALTGRVPTKVKGPVNKGDLVVASSVPGVAKKLVNNFYAPGCIIGKALDIIDDDSVKTIEVVIGRF